ncbi:MAG TPA: creatininase family protein [bacterium]|nr:creatininase family protein [bacterium]
MKPGKNVRFETMTPGELERAVLSTPVAWVPVGTLEWHGRHLPVGLDAIKAHALCLRAADIAGGVVLPANYCSILGMRFPWTFRQNPAVFARNYFDILVSLKKYGFKSIIILTGHYPPEQVLALMALSETFTALYRAPVVAIPEFAMAEGSGYAGDHAAVWETSLMMALFPELVDAGELEQLSGLSSFDLWKKGIQGKNPADGASAEHGENTVGIITENLAALAAEMLSSRSVAVSARVHRNALSYFLRENIKQAPDLFSEIAASAGLGGFSPFSSKEKRE